MNRPALPNLCALFATLLALRAAAAAAPPAVLFTADVQGHVTACQVCPGHKGMGGLDRRGTLLHQLAADHPGSVIVDAGESLFGEESADSGGAVIADAYAAMGYAVVNLGPGDFRQGRDHTLDLLRAAKLAATSANLLDATTSQPLAEPVVVRMLGTRKVAFIGLADPPAALPVLPRLKRQLAGIRFRPCAEALAEWLPKAHAQADAVVVLYDGSPTGLRAVRAACGTSASAILAAGVGELPSDAVIATTESHGRAVGVATLTDAGAAFDHELVLPSLSPDPAVAAVIARYAPPAMSLPTPVPVATRPITTPAIASAPPPPVAATPVPIPPPVRVPAPIPAPTNVPKPVPAPPAITGRRVPAHSPLQPHGLAGVGLTAEQVNAAIDRGSVGLWNLIRTKDLKKDTRFGADQVHVLAALALVHCDLHKRSPEFDAAVRSYLTNVDPYAVGTYQCGLLAMLIEAYGDPVFDDKLRQATRYLLEAQGPDGTWNYGVTVPPDLAGDGSRNQPLRVVGGRDPDEQAVPDARRWQRLTPWDREVTGDNSSSQFALLGLQAAARSQVDVSVDLWHRALASYGKRQLPDGGWAYDAIVTRSYGSMTSAGICATVICRHELGVPDPAADPAVERGLGWMADHFTLSANPNSNSYRMYYLYSLERVGRVLDTEFIGDHEWYPEGARALLDAQHPDGTWPEDQSETDGRITTSFALLFLTRATPTLAAAPKHGGTGTLRTEVASPPPAAVYVILDASGSMLDEMGGRPKFDVARAAVADLVATLPDHAKVALRVYGHHHRAIDPGANEDTALEIPMAELDRDAFAKKLASLRPRGLTPMALSMDDALKDLGSTVDAAHPVTVILLTDGGEDTRPRRDPVKSAAVLGHMKGITFHIVGFDIHEQDWSDQLHAMCDAGNARYWPATDAADLRQDVRSAVLGIPRAFTVVDPAGRSVVQGQFGDQHPLPEGRYTLTATYAGHPYSAPFQINTDATTGVLFDASRAGAVPPAPAPPASTPTPAVAARFCTQCGHALPAGAKFCPACGTPVAQK